MKKFLLQFILIFLLPLLLIFALSEIILRLPDNEYKYKNSYLVRNKSSLEVLCLGSSSVYFGINPHYFTFKTFNASHVSQTLNYDNFIMEKFADQMDSLKCVILSVDYWSPFMFIETAREPWRAKNYHIYYGCDYHKYDPKFNLETYNFNLVMWKRVYTSVNSLLSGKVELGIDSLGYGTDYTLSRKKANWEDDGPLEARKHTKKINPEILKQSEEYIDKISRKCQEKNIIFLILTVPSWTTYNKNLNEKQLEIKNNLCASFEKKYKNTYYINMLEDSRFFADDFYDSDHLNEFGAKKLSLIVNDTIKYFLQKKMTYVSK